MLLENSLVWLSFEKFTPQGNANGLRHAATGDLGLPIFAYFGMSDRTFSLLGVYEVCNYLHTCTLGDKGETL